MSQFLDECQQHFGTKKLYEVLGLTKTATEAEIKTAYRKKSLTVHPDRAPDSDKERAKEAFQTLSKVYNTLSNEEHRKVYDDTGMIVTEDDANISFESFEDAIKFWRQTFPKISTQQIEDFERDYKGSDEERKDLIELYTRYEGNLDRIFEAHMFYIEEEVQEQLKAMIADGTIPALDAFVKEPPAKTKKRLRMIAREKAEAEREAQKKAKKTGGGGPDGDLVAAILANRERSWSNSIDALAAKYGGGGTKKKIRRR